MAPEGLKKRLGALVSRRGLEPAFRACIQVLYQGFNMGVIKILGFRVQTSMIVYNVIRYGSSRANVYATRAPRVFLPPSNRKPPQQACNRSWTCQ